MPRRHFSASVIMQKRVVEIESSVLPELVLFRKLESVVAEFGSSPLLLEAASFRERSDWLARLDVLLDDSDLGAIVPSQTQRQARKIRARLEGVNDTLYRSIRAEIQQGRRPAFLSGMLCEDTKPVGGLSFDFLDELVIGVLQLEEPDSPPPQPPAEMVFYQPTPARHIFDLLRLTAPGQADVLIDFGSGLGHVALLASICTGARCIGIEREESYVRCARHAAERLHLHRATFVQQDAREAELSVGTVFYLYTPFTGAILADVLSRLQQQSQSRLIRVCTFGPCTGAIAREPWLESDVRPDPDRITVFCSRN